MDLPHGNQHMYHLAQAQRPLYPQRTDRLDDILFEPADTSDNASALEEYRELYRHDIAPWRHRQGADNSLARRKAI